jgi:hypothetical protein
MIEVFPCEGRRTSWSVASLTILGQAFSERWRMDAATSLPSLFFALRRRMTRQFVGQVVL